MAVKIRKGLLTHPFKVLAIWIMVPVIGLLFYSGNKGYVWSYYLTGVYPIVIIIVSAVLYEYSRQSKKGWLLIGGLLALSVLDNGSAHLKLYRQSTPSYITLSQSAAAVDWTFSDSSGKPFNYDVYVPPMIYAAYDYLYLWRGNMIHHTLPQQQLVSRLYTIFEPDSDHQVLLNTWMTRQATLGSIEQTVKFGNVSVQRRHRFSTDEHK